MAIGVLTVRVVYKTGDVSMIRYSKRYFLAMRNDDDEMRILYLLSCSYLYIAYMDFNAYYLTSITSIHLWFSRRIPV